MKSVVQLLILLICLSCQTNDKSKTVFIKSTDFKKEYSLNYTSSLDYIKQLNPSKLIVSDSLLIVQDWLENPRIHFYNKYTHNKIAEYGFIGDGPDEYKNPEFNGQFFTEDNSLFFLLYEFGYGLFYKIDANAVFDHKPTARKNKFFLNPEIRDADNLFLKANNIIGEAVFNNDIKYFNYSLDQNSFKKLGVNSESEFLMKVPTEDKKNIDRSLLHYSEKNDKMVAGYVLYNKIIIMNSEMVEIKTIIYGENENTPNSISPGSRENIRYFDMPYAGDKYIYIAHFGKKLTVENEYDKEILIFDYDGNAVAKLQLNTPLESFTVDEMERKLYVASGSEEQIFFIYDLPEL